MSRSALLIFVVTAVLGLAVEGVWAQQARLEFEVASVLPGEPGAPAGGIARPVNGLVRATRPTVRQMIQYAFDLMPIQRHDPESVGGPAWIDSERFDVVARGPDTLSFADSRAMMRSLLEDRFKLRTHVEQRELPVYVLELAKRDGSLGPGLRRSTIDCAAYSATLTATGRGAAAKEVGPQCGLTTGGAPAVAAALGITNSAPRGAMMSRGTATLVELIAAISRSPDIDRKVFDRTGLSGTFDVDLLWNPLRSGAFTAAPADVVPISSALEEQLGLRLVSRHEPIDLVIIDSVERPTPN